jgi:hypothetical protein
MNDDDLFRAYRPAGPPPELRARIVSATRRAKASAERGVGRPALRDWLPALAAAALIALFGTLSYRLQANIETKLAVPDDLRPVEQWVSDDVGGLK